MIPIPPSHIADYSTWLNQNHPKSRKHYLSLLRAMQRFFGNPDEIPSVRINDWIQSIPKAQDRRTARKCLRKYLSWLADSSGLRVPIPALDKPVPEHGIPDVQWAKIEANKTGPIHSRQLYVMAFLHRTTSLPASAIGQLLIEGVDLTPGAPALRHKGRTFPVPHDAAQALSGWMLIRERLATSPEDARLQRKSEAWAKSPFVFPKSDGSASPYAVIWRLRKTHKVPAPPRNKPSGLGHSPL